MRSEVSFTVRGFCVLPSLHLSKAKPVFGVAWTVCVLPSSKVPPPETLPWLSLAERTVSVRFFGCVVPPGDPAAFRQAMDFLWSQRGSAR